MDDVSKKEMNAHYSDLLNKHGLSIEALGSKSMEQLTKRFAMLSNIEPITAQSSILDVGCGLGHLCDYMRNLGWKGKYTGIDINPDMVAAARERLPNDELICLDVLTEHFDNQYDYVICGAAIQHKPTYENPDEYFEKMITKLFSIAKKALSFDIFSGRVDYKDDDKLYIEPIRLLQVCYSLSDRIVFRNDYRPYEIVVYIFKEVSKDEFNVYSKWKPLHHKII